MTFPIGTRKPGSFQWWKNSDVRCPNTIGRDPYAELCREMVNVQCWRCGWHRDPDERKAVLDYEAMPAWWGARWKTEQVINAKNEEARNV
jgi:hypothetical protein